LELAHYEWVELALSLDTHEIALETDGVATNTEIDLLQGIPILSPLAWPLAYAFPVHRISPDFQPRQAPDQPTRLLAYRNRRDEVKFMEINPVTWLLLEKLQPANLSGYEILQSIASAIGRDDHQPIIEHGKKLLQDLQQRDVVLGTRA
jgi:hypothetical protein